MVNAKIFAATAVATIATAAPLQQRAAAFTPPSGNGTFNLVALAYDGDLSLSGLWLSVGGAHSAAATEQPYFYKQPSSGYPEPGYLFNATTGDIYYQTSNDAPYYGQPFSLAASYSIYCGFDNDIDPATIPANYSCQEASVGWANKGFSFNPENNHLRPNSYADSVFSICPLKEIPREYSYNGTIYGFMTRAKETDKAKGCADVHLMAVF